MVIVGAGFAGLYMIYRARQCGLSVQCYEIGEREGGTWYWNRYPGARVDIECVEYSYSFSKELEQEWDWSERYASQPEIERYANHVAERFDLRRDIQFNTRVTAAHFDESTQRWQVETDTGERVSARFCIMATGLISAPIEPRFKGLDDFAGEQYLTSRWPGEEPTFAGKSGRGNRHELLGHSSDLRSRAGGRTALCASAHTVLHHSFAQSTGRTRARQ